MLLCLLLLCMMLLLCVLLLLRMLLLLLLCVLLLLYVEGRRVRLLLRLGVSSGRKRFHVVEHVWTGARTNGLRICKVLSVIPGANGVRHFGAGVLEGR